jgi:SAM-dependent methyltransferase
MQNTWNTALYETQHAFVWQSATDLIELLSPQPEEHILDLGCGTGQLTAQIANSGALVRGIDADATMIAKAQQNYPQLKFAQADARNFQVEEPLDAIFSNAVLHWVKAPDAAIQCIARALKSGGRFVAEFGGQGNTQAITQALSEACAEIEHPCTLPWYFPSLGDYASRSEKYGLEVVYGTLRDRPTPLEGKDAGLANWLRMFANGVLMGLNPEMQDRVIQSVEAKLNPKLYRDQIWVADYRRLRLMAIKQSGDKP